MTSEEKFCPTQHVAPAIHRLDGPSYNCWSEVGLSGWLQPGTPTWFNALLT
jgi:hypothetical protein